MELLECLDYSTLMKNKAKWKKELLSRPNMREIRIAVLCGSTFGVAQEFLELFLLYYGIKADFFVGEYNRFYEEAVFNNESLECFKPDVVLLYVTNKNLLISQDYMLDESTEQMLKGERLRWNQIWDHISKVYKCIIIQNNFELFEHRMIGNAARTSSEGVLKYVDDINRHVLEAVNSNEYLYLNDINYLSARVGLLKWHDNKMWQLYKYAINMDALPLYALNTANIIKSIWGINKKAIATDLDNTLWGGVIGEVGASGIKQGLDSPQGEAYSRFQRYLKRLSKQGVLLNVCSKNEYEIACEGFRLGSSVLKEKDFIKIKANWKNKPENIREIAEEIHLMPESFVFLDDNSVECESVRFLCPEVLSLQVKSPFQAMEELDILSPFEGAGDSREDALRIQLYQSEIKRSSCREEYSSYEEYLSSLKTRCFIENLNEGNLERAVQLLNKTNQFNFLTNRYTIQQYKEFNNAPNVFTLVARLSDRFGDAGIISIMTIAICEEIAVIHDWVMSCRVLERKVENVLLHKAFQLCQKHGVQVLAGLYLPTGKNKKIRELFSFFGFYRHICKDEDKDKILSIVRNIGINTSQLEIWICDAIDEAKASAYTTLITVEE